MSLPQTLGKASLVSTVATDIYNPSGVSTAFSIKFINSTGGPATIRCSVSATTATIEQTGRIIPDDITLPNGGSHEVTGQIIQDGEFLVAESDTTGVTVRAVGWEV